MKILGFVGVAGVLLAAALGMPQFAQAATITWDGGGATNNWSDCLNWSGDVCPGAADVATFNATSTKASRINAAFTIQSLVMESGYTNTVTQAANLRLSNNFTHSTSDGRFTRTAGTLTFFGAAPGVWDVDTGDDQFGAVAVSKNQNIAVDIASGDTVRVQATLTLSNGKLNAGTVDARGNITQNAGFDGGTTTIDFGAAAAQTYTVNGGKGPGVRFDEAGDASDTLAFAGAATMNAITTTAGFSGAIPLTNATNATLTMSNWNQAAGTYDASAQSLWKVTNFTITGGTFIAPSTVTPFSVCYWDFNGVQHFNNITMANGPLNSAQVYFVDSADTVTVDGTLTLNNGDFDSGDYTPGGIFDPSIITINVNGNVVQTGSFYGGNDYVTVSFTNDAVAQTYTANGGNALITLFDSVADAADSFVANADIEIDGIKTTAAFTGNIPLVNNAPNYLYIAQWSQMGGNYDASADAVWYIEDFDTGAGTTFVAPQLVEMTNGFATWDVNGTQVFNDFDFATSSSIFSKALGTGDTLVINGDLIFTRGWSQEGTIEAHGDVVVLPSFSAGSTTKLVFAGDANQTFNLSGATGLYDGDVSINKTAGTVTLASDMALDAVGQDFSIIAGTFDVSTSNYTVSLAGDWTNTGSFVARTGNVNLVGGNQSIAGITTFNNLSKHATVGATLTLPASTLTTVTGLLDLQGASATDRLNIRSSLAGTQTQLDSRSVRILNNLNVQDNANVHVTTMTCGSGCVDLGNNTNWTF